jgi:hypothetical protein
MEGGASYSTTYLYGGTRETVKHLFGQAAPSIFITLLHIIFILTHSHA